MAYTPPPCVAEHVKKYAHSDAAKAKEAKGAKFELDSGPARKESDASDVSAGDCSMATTSCDEEDDDNDSVMSDISELSDD